MRIAVAGGTGTIGRYVVGAAADAGHDTVVLSRSRGVDVHSGAGLAGALRGAEVVIDVTNPGTMDRQEAGEFFTTVAARLQTTGSRCGVRHIVTVSIVGIDAVTFGYYQAKLDHERAAATGPVPATVMRATQLHEFTAQLVAATRDRFGTAHVFDVPVQPVAARTVGQVLLQVATGDPAGRARDLAGPARGNLVNLARVYAARHAPGTPVEPDRVTMADAAQGALLPGPDARIAGPDFDQWLGTDDAAPQ